MQRNHYAIAGGQGNSSPTKKLQNNKESSKGWQLHNKSNISITIKDPIGMFSQRNITVAQIFRLKHRRQLKNMLLMHIVYDSILSTT